MSIHPQLFQKGDIVCFQRTVSTFQLGIQALKQACPLLITLLGVAEHPTEVGRRVVSDVTRHGGRFTFSQQELDWTRSSALRVRLIGQRDGSWNVKLQVKVDVQPDDRSMLFHLTDSDHGWTRDLNEEPFDERESQ